MDFLTLGYNYRAEAFLAGFTEIPVKRFDLDFRFGDKDVWKLSKFPGSINKGAMPWEAYFMSSDWPISGALRDLWSFSLI